MSEASGVPSWARAGAKVVCINVAPIISSSLEPNLSGLSVGSVYTITDLCPHQYTGNVGVRLAEIRRPLIGNDRYEQPFALSRFRPAVEDSDELGIEAQFYRAKSRKSKAPTRESERA